MGFRFRRSIKILPGIRLNLGKRGVSVSAGVRGARVTVGKDGTRTTVGIPGSGVSYTNYERHHADRPSQAAADDSPVAPRGEVSDSTVVVILALVVAAIFCFGF